MQLTYNVGTRSDVKKNALSQTLCAFLENNDKGLKTPQATSAAFNQSTLSVRAAAQLCTIVLVLKVARTSPSPWGRADDSSSCSARFSDGNTI